MRINQRTIIEETVTLTEDEMTKLDSVIVLLHNIAIKSADTSELEADAHEVAEILESFACNWLTNVL